MKRKSSFIVAASLITALLLAVTAGCSDPAGGKATGKTGGDVTAVKILRDGKEVKIAINAHAGGTVEFTAKVTVTGGADDSVTWKVAGKKASGTNINGNGRLTIGAESTGTTLTVTATSTVKKTLSKSVTVKVVAAESRTELVISWPDALETPSVAQGDTLQLYVEDENGGVPYVLWEIVGDHSEGTFIDSGTGELYIAEDETADIMIIRVTSMEDGDLYNEEEITIIKNNTLGGGDGDADTDADGDGDKPPPQGTLTIKPAPASVSQGQSLQFTVEASNPDLLPVTWAITSSGNSAGTTINNTGFLTVASNETLTSLTIRATSNGNNTVSATQTVTITQVTAPVTPGNFTITYGPFTGGNITGPASAAQGTFVQITLTINSDRRFESVTVTKTGPETGTVGASGTGDKRTFIMPGSNVSITAVFAQNLDKTAYLSENFDTSKCSFFDKFDGTGTNLNKNGVNKAKWGFENKGDGFGNGEAQYYRGEENAVVKDGILSLILKKEAFGGRQYTSAKLVTVNTAINPGQQFSQTYGRFEAKIRLVSKAAPGTPVVGFWPAWWMMPRTSAYGGWPRSGEIDIMEMKGRLPRESSSTLHWYPGTGWQSRYRGANVEFPASSSISDWHVYGVRWEQEAMIFLFDGMEHVRITRTDWRNGGFYDARGASAPFDQDFYLILNFAVGGNFDSGGALPPDSALPASLDIDWVRVYTLANDPWPIDPIAGSGYTPRNFKN